jgi:hypothetical protein
MPSLLGRTRRRAKGKLAHAWLESIGRVGAPRSVAVGFCWGSSRSHVTVKRCHFRRGSSAPNQPAPRYAARRISLPIATIWRCGRACLPKVARLRESRGGRGLGAETILQACPCVIGDSEPEPCAWTESTDLRTASKRKLPRDDYPTIRPYEAGFWSGSGEVSLRTNGARARRTK